MDSHEEFMRKIPRGPLANHINQIDMILLHMHGWSEGYSENAVHIARHSLSEIAAYTAEPELRYGYGVVPPQRDVSDVISRMQRSVKEAFENVASAVEKMRAKQPLDELNERVSVRRYNQAVKDERAKGLAFVKAEAARVEKELGL